VADWLDSADKVASIVGALTGVAALAITLRDRNRRPERERDTVAAPPMVQAFPPLPATAPVTDSEPQDDPRPTTPVVEPDPYGPRPGTPGAGPVDGGLPPYGQAPPPVAGRPVQARRSSGSGVGFAVGLLVYCAGTALLGAWLLSWLGGGSIGPWWLLAALVVSFVVGVFFSVTDPRESAGTLVLYIIWIPTAAFLGARGVANYWLPNLFGSQETAFFVVFFAVLVIGVAGAFVPRGRASRR
jgi:hypothetical protein